MKKPNKAGELDNGIFQGVILHLGEPVETIDQDKLQLIDELNKDWVNAWHKEVQRIERKARRPRQKTRGVRPAQNR